MTNNLIPGATKPYRALPKLDLATLPPPPVPLYQKPVTVSPIYALTATSFTLPPQGCNDSSSTDVQREFSLVAFEQLTSSSQIYLLAHPSLPRFPIFEIPPANTAFSSSEKARLLRKEIVLQFGHFAIVVSLVSLITHRRKS